MNKEKFREYIAKTFISSGVAIFVGSIGACENGDYSLLQCVICVTCGIALILVGAKMRKEDMCHTNNL